MADRAALVGTAEGKTRTGGGHRRVSSVEPDGAGARRVAHQAQSLEEEVAAGAVGEHGLLHHRAAARAGRGRQEPVVHTVAQVEHTLYQGESLQGERGRGGGVAVVSPSRAPHLVVRGNRPNLGWRGDRGAVARRLPPDTAEHAAEKDGGAEDASRCRGGTRQLGVAPRRARRPIPMNPFPMYGM